MRGPRGTQASWLGVLGALALVGTTWAAPPASYSDPANFPAPWPAFANYTSEGAVQADLRTTGADASIGPSAVTAPDDFSSGSPDGSASSVFYTGFSNAGTEVLAFRVRLRSSPLSTIGKDAPLVASRWNLLVDTDGDGFKEYLVTINGATVNTFATSPDDMAVYFNNNASQAVVAGDRLWVQDVAGPSDGLDGGLVIDTNPSSFIWDYGRIRVTQIDTGLPPGDPGSEYYLDFQVPLQAFDASGAGGTALAVTDCVQFAFTTSDSNFDPTRQDLIYPGTFAMAAATNRLPFGDVVCPTDTPRGPPVVTQVAYPGCPPPANLQATVRDALIDDGSSGVTDSLAFVRFEYYRDLDGNGSADDGLSWTTIGNGAASGSPSTFVLAWDTTTLPQGAYLVRVVTQDDQGNTTTSSAQAFPGNRIATFSNTCGVAGATILGNVYDDANHNRDRDGGEGSTGLALFVKAYTTGGGGFLASGTVDATTGDYSVFIPGGGTVDLVLDDNATGADTTPTVADRVGTEVPTLIRTAVVAASGTTVTDQDFGLFHGSFLTGRVFTDTGTGGGTANDGAQNGGETGRPSVRVTLEDAGGVIDEAQTDSAGDFEFWIRASVGAVALTVRSENSVLVVSTGGDAGTTGGTYTRASDTVAFTNALGSSYTGLRFGDVPTSRFVQDHEAVVRQGTANYYGHVFSPGTSGSVTYTLTSASSPPGVAWTALLYPDPDCDGLVAGGASPLTGAVAVTAGVDHCTVLRVFAPQGAPDGARDRTVVTATLTYTGAAPALVQALENVDVTKVGQADGLELIKAVSTATAAPGDPVTYTITYRNSGAEAIGAAGLAGAIVISDSTPDFTTFVSAAEPSTPAGLTAVSRTDPGAGGTGAVEWSFTGVLRAHEVGTVTFTVQIQ